MDLNSLADFVAVADGGGITAAARARNEPKQTISRRLQRLEEALGVRLFDRTTRALRLTDEGRLLRLRVASALADIEEVRRELSDRAEEPRGVLRLSAPMLLGHTLLGKLIATYALSCPEVDVDVVLSDRRVDLVEEGFDVAIRVGALDDSSLIARRLGRGETVLVAAPSLLERVGHPEKPADLAKLPCIHFGARRELIVWSLRQNNQEVAVSVAGQIAANSLMLCRDAAIAGAGVAALPAFVIRDAVQSGHLVRVLPDWLAGADPISIVYPSRRQTSARLRIFVETANDYFASIAL